LSLNPPTPSEKSDSSLRSEIYIKMINLPDFTLKNTVLDIGLSN